MSSRHKQKGTQQQGEEREENEALSLLVQSDPSERTKRVDTANNGVPEPPPKNHDLKSRVIGGSRSPLCSAVLVIRRLPLLPRARGPALRHRLPR
jgi:hypothetical protein